MKVIIAGSRSFNMPIIMDAAIKTAPFDITEVVSGHAAGADTLGENWADANGIDKVIFPANWKKYGKAAGPIRNEKMANYADAAIIFWDGKSTGSKNMISNMEKLNKPVYVINF